MKVLMEGTMNAIWNTDSEGIGSCENAYYYKIYDDESMDLWLLNAKKYPSIYYDSKYQFSRHLRLKGKYK